MTIDSKQVFNFTAKDSNLVITDSEKERVISFINNLENKMDFNGARYDVRKIGKFELEQFIVKSFSDYKIIDSDKTLSNEFTLSLAGYYEEEIKKMGNAHLKIINIFSSKTSKNNVSVLKNTIKLVNINLLANGIYSLLKRNGIKKIDIQINVYYSMEIQNLYYDFDVKAIGTSVFENENMIFSERQKFRITEFELDNYIKNQKPNVKDFLYDFDIMKLQMFDKKEVLKNFSAVIEQLKLINY